ADMKYGNNPIQSFVHSSGCCVLGAEHKVSRTAFRDRLSRWWNVSGLNGMCPSAEDVGKTLRAIVPGLKDGKGYEGSARGNGDQGIGLVQETVQGVQDNRSRSPGQRNASHPGD